MSPMTIDALQAQYPSPVSASAPRTPGTLDAAPVQAYCVGGALMHAMGWTAAEFAFPSLITLSNVLQQANHALDMVQSMAYARQILADNDAGRFANAWMALEAALKEC